MPRLLFKIVSIWLALLILQAFIFADEADVWSYLLAGAGGWFGLFLFGKPALLRRYPISTSMMIGYTLSYFIFPPLITLAEGKPLSNNLHHPNLVFTHAAICFAALAAAYRAYIWLRLTQGIRQTVSQHLYKPFGFFRSPSNAQLILMGLIGLAAMAQQVFFMGSAQGVELGTDSKFIQGLYPLCYVPYCILAPQLIGGPKGITMRWKAVLAGYTALLVLVSIGANSRSAFLMGIVSLGLAYMYAHSAGLIKTRLFTPKRLIASALGILVLSGPVADLSLAMVYARTIRTETDAVSLLEETLQIYSDSRLFNARKEESALAVNLWDERYVDNLFFSRVSNLKFADNSIDLAIGSTPSNRRRLAALEWDRVWANLPQPMIEALGLDVEKGFVKGASGGDLLLYTAVGDFLALGGFRTGSIFGSGFALFGWWYPAVLGFAAMLLFPLADAQTLRTKHGAFSVIFNPLAVVGFFTWMFYLTSAASGVEALSGMANFPMRGWLQVFFVYITVFWLTALLLRLIRSSNTHKNEHPLPRFQ